MENSQNMRWQDIVRRYQNPSNTRSTLQILSCAAPFFVLWYLMFQSLKIHYVLTVPLILITGGFVIRVFIIQHDCGHGSFFRSQRMNDIIGSIIGIFTLVPYHHWKKTHALHHQHTGKLGEMRGVGDFYTKTVDEYFSGTRLQRLWYRFYRNTFFLIGLGPFLVFVFGYRIPGKLARKNGWHKELASVYFTNAGIVLMASLAIWLVGWKAFLLIQLPLTYVVVTVGAWLFFIQHQYEGAYWAYEGEWSFADAALQGASYCKLPRLLQWFTGNIGFHHIHHLSPKIPNYRLQQCFEENPVFQDVQTTTFLSSFKTLALGLWDEKKKRLITFREATNIHKSSSAAV